MVYRFMLEVPERVRKDAEIEISRAPATQIVISRKSNAEGFDTPVGALTVSSDDLNVVERVYGWFEATGDAAAGTRLVLYSGEKREFAGSTSGELVAAIRGDQPWIDHAIPRIGDHVEDDFVTAGSGAGSGPASTGVRRQSAGVMVAERPRSNVVEHVNYVAINVTALRKAEQFYFEFFDMDLVGRIRTAADGSRRLVESDYSWDKAIVAESTADYSYLRNGPLVLALHDAGGGARLERTVLDRVSVQVDAKTYTAWRAKVLMRSLELLHDGELSFSFRDPYGVPWEITLAGLLPDIVIASLRDAV